MDNLQEMMTSYMEAMTYDELRAAMADTQIQISDIKRQLTINNGPGFVDETLEGGWKVRANAALAYKKRDYYKLCALAQQKKPPKSVAPDQKSMDRAFISAAQIVLNKEQYLAVWDQAHTMFPDVFARTITPL